MGVTYKLKQEVIDCIIKKKQQDPALSCRKLTAIIHETFKVDVSKSSINAVIKEFNLSNPVGRRPERTSKNFNIPIEKKQQLLAQVVPFLPAEVPEQVPLLPDLLQQPSLPPLIEAKPVEALHEGALSKQELEQEPATPSLPVKTSIDNTGIFFVRAIMQDILRRPIIGQALASVASGGYQNEEILEAAVFLSALGVSSAGDIHSAQIAILWDMFEITPKEGKDILDRLLGRNIPLPSLAMMLEVELKAAFTEGHFFKLIADNGRCFYISADLTTILSGSEGGMACPAFKSVQMAVERLVVASEPLVIDIDEGAVYLDFLRLLDGRLAEKLDKVELWSNNGEVLWEHILNSGKKVDFIAKIIKKDDTALGDFRVSVAGKNTLLTNILPARASLQEILEKYIERMLFIDESPHNYISNDDRTHKIMGLYSKKETILGGSHTLFEFLANLYKIFEKITCNVLFPFDIDQVVYDDIIKMPGYVRNTRAMRQIYLMPGKTFSHKQALEMAVNRVNRMYVTDYLGRKFSFSIEYPAE